MFRSALAAALRHLYRGKLYAAIAVLGLAVGLCAALVAALYIRSQYSYDHFVPGYQDVYQVTMTTNYPDRPRTYDTYTPHSLAALIKQRFPEVLSVARLASQGVMLRLGDIEDTPRVWAVDPDFFATLSLPALGGDPAGALARPDTVVITSGIAHEFFGKDSPLGRTLEVVPLSGQGATSTVTVGAVIRDVPEYRTQVPAGVFVSGRSTWTGLSWFDTRPFYAKSGMSSEVLTLVRLRAGASPQRLRNALPQLVPQIGGSAAAAGGSGNASFDMLRIDRIHTNTAYNVAFTHTIAVTVALALVILVIAAVNFVNLLTARSGTRSLEVGVRKLAGASRIALAVQFLGEAVGYVAVAVVLAGAMTEWLLPHVNAFFQADAEFDYWQQPALAGWLVLGAMACGLLAGFWPAMVLSSLRPLGVMHGARVARGRGGVLGQWLVAMQFAVPAALMLAAGVMYLQRQYATERTLRFDADKVLILHTGCSSGRITELRKLAGVLDAACSGSQLLGGDGASNGLDIRARDGHSIPVGGVWIDDRTLALYGIHPLAGRVLAADDFGAGFFGRHSSRVVINEAAMRALGFHSPAEALGPYPLMRDTAALSNGRPAGSGFDEIVGVVPDFSMAGARLPVGPTVFYADPMQFSTISLKLKGTDVAATLAAINRVWKNTRGRGGDLPVGRLDYMFYSDRVQRMYYGMQVEERAYEIMSVVAISLALLGLLGLAAAAADRRTKEIGIRKAMGATTGDVLRLLLWQFSRPVVWANLIAWPLAGWAMHGWLDGFAYHIDLPLWLFPVTTLATVLVALGTVCGHALRVARARPVTALRHE